MAHTTRPSRPGTQHPFTSETAGLVPLHIAIHPELHATVVEAAEQTGVSISEATSTLLAMGLANREEMQTIVDKALAEKFQSENIQKEVNKHARKEVARFLLSLLSFLLPAGRKKKLAN